MQARTRSCATSPATRSRSISPSSASPGSHSSTKITSRRSGRAGSSGSTSPRRRRIARRRRAGAGRADLWNLATGTLDVARRGGQISQTLAYEPTTQVVALGLDQQELDRFDPKTRKLVRLVALSPRAFSTTRLFPLAPSLAHGEQVI